MVFFRFLFLMVFLGALAAASGAEARDPVIVLDPGHGGADPGAISSAMREKDISLEFALALKRALSSRGSYRILLTRESDRFLSLRERVLFARSHQADLFISIHADSSLRREVGGFAVYSASKEASDAHAEALARRENAGFPILGINRQETLPEARAIILDLAGRESQKISHFFARALLPQLGGLTPLLDSPHRFANFHVLSAPDIPSVLIELGFLSNPEDRKRLARKTFRDKLARAIARALDRFFEERRLSVNFR